MKLCVTYKIKLLSIKSSFTAFCISLVICFVLFVFFHLHQQIKRCEGRKRINYIDKELVHYNGTDTSID